MNIVYLANIRMPTEKAHGIQIMKMCEAFAENEAQVTLLVPTRRNPQWKDTDPFVLYGVKKNFTLRFLPTIDPWWLIYVPQGIYIKFQTLFFIISAFFFLLLSKKLRSGAVAYTREEYLLPLLQLFFKDTVWETHNLPHRSRYYLRAWQRCRAVIAISEGLRQRLIEIGIGISQIQRSPDAVDMGPFEGHMDKAEARRQLGLPQDKHIALYAGHLYKWKGVYTLAKAAQHLGGDDLIVFVGGTENDIRSFRNALKTSNTVFVAGYVAPTLIPTYLAAADVLILPNSEHSEVSKDFTSPMKLFEYMAARRPIVASDLPSIREILNEKNSILVAPDDSSALAHGIKKTILESEASANRTKQAFSDVQAYTWRKRTSTILKFITR